MKSLVRTGRYALIMTVALGLAACGNSTSGPSVPDVTGTYSGGWTLTTQIHEGGDFDAVTCSGSIAISQQNEGTISGSFELQSSSADCNGLSSSGGIAGSVQSGGGVTFELSVLDQSRNGFEAILPDYCTFLRGDTELSGSIDDGSMSVSASNVVECNGAEVSVTYQFLGS